MTTVSMLDFRQNAKDILDRVSRGQTLVLSYRGKPVARTEPIRPKVASTKDVFYRLDSLADDQGESMTNEAMDEAVYGA